MLEAKSMRTVTCIEDLRQTARRKVPRAFFDYAEAGSYSEATLRANREDLERIKLRQRVLVDVSQRDLATTIMGEKVSLPLALAPIGLCGMQHGDGEILACHVRGMENVNALAQWTANEFDPALNWKDVEWIRSLWPGKLILKGILDVEDARTAAKIGAGALVVSNHGGRQLDGAPSSIWALPKAVEAVGGVIRAMSDGRIRSGQDVVRALACAARACMIGRAYIYGIGAGGEAGVAAAIDILARELDVTMALCGVKSVRDIDRNVITPG